MDKILETLCNEWLNNRIKVSPEYERILKKYGNKNFNAYVTIADAVEEEQKTAFEAGFRTAVQLLMGGVQS